MYVDDAGLRFEGAVADLIGFVRRQESEAAVRWVWWSATEAAPLVRAGLRLQRSWDLSAAHRMLAGGHSAAADEVWATAAGLDPAERPAAATNDLFDLATGGGPTVRADGYLDPDVLQSDWRAGHLRELAELALVVAGRQQDLLSCRSRAVATTTSESGASLLCTELEVVGLPIDRPELERLITEIGGPRPADESDAARIRRDRDAAVLDLVPGRGSTDLRNPAHVRELLQSLGIRIDDTRAWQLEPYRDVHPVVGALLEWRKAERIATTYGWSWIDRFTGPDDRLRGVWTACDGGAGRMTAGAGLHSLPAALRSAVAAEPGHLLVRADLGQVEPRVLAVVSGDRRFAAATADDDLYATVADQLKLDRPAAKIAVLAAMYGQTSGSAAEALRRMDRTFGDAMSYLRRAADDGEQGRDVTTYGGRLINGRPAADPLGRRAVGRFTRNAVVQGAAAEFFKAWALTVRAAIAPIDGEIVLCLHDELLVHVPTQHAQQAADLVRDAVDAAARRWSSGAPVRFVADVRVVRRWSEAKD